MTSKYIIIKWEQNPIAVRLAAHILVVISIGIGRNGHEFSMI